MSNTSKPTIRVWITKYALTKGIIEADAELCDGINGKMIAVRRTSNINFDVYYHKPHWFTSRNEAMNRVRWMIATKVGSLKKSLTKMERLAKEYKETVEE